MSRKAKQLDRLLQECQAERLPSVAAAVVRKGEIVHRSPTSEFRRNAPLASRLLGV